MARIKPGSSAQAGLRVRIAYHGRCSDTDRACARPFGHPDDKAIGMCITPEMAGAWRCPVIRRQILGSMSGEQPMNRDGR